MSARLRLGAVLVLAALGATAHPARAQDRHRSWVAPEAAASKANPLAGRPETAAGGKKLFGQRCAMCHGDDARGSRHAPDLLARRVQAQTDGVLFWKIGSGNTRAGMPSFSFLPPLERWQLVLHLRSLAAARVSPSGP